jgi:hypothetical protein
MAGNVVYLAYSSKNAMLDAQALTACKECRNKTFKIIHDGPDFFPLLQCAACDAHISRIGLIPEK